jgi:hypothetical protein
MSACCLENLGMKHNGFHTLEPPTLGRTHHVTSIGVIIQGRNILDSYVEFYSVPKDPTASVAGYSAVLIYQNSTRLPHKTPVMHF